MKRSTIRVLRVLFLVVCLFYTGVIGLRVCVKLVFPPYGRIYNCTEFDVDMLRLIQQEAKISLPEGAVIEKATIVGGQDYNLSIRIKVPLAGLDSLVQSFSFPYRQEKPGGIMGELIKGELVWRIEKGWDFDPKRVQHYYRDESAYRKVYVCYSKECYDVFLVCQCEEWRCGEMFSRFRRSFGLKSAIESSIRGREQGRSVTAVEEFLQ